VKGNDKMKTVYEKSKGLSDNPLSYCPGCSHGTIHKLVAEVLAELDVLGDTIGVAPVGCAVFAYNYFNFDVTESPHGRAPAVATGIKRVYPDKVVFTYQGDGDLAAIGTSEIVHAAHRGEKITTIFVNNTTYGMTGGQLAPTTLVDQYATTAPKGRDESSYGKPIRMSELLATIDGARFIERVSVDSPANIRKAKKAIKNAFLCQLNNIGFSMVEVLSACPTNWKMTPVKSMEWLREKMIPYYPLGNLKRPEEAKG
jgi:2-oxoglutarate/2-oxoacid ferredoxin oxidoreductase subunit beta